MKTPDYNYISSPLDSRMLLHVRPMHEEHIAVQYNPQAILHQHDIINKTVSGATSLLDITGFNIPSSNYHPHSVGSTS